MTTTLIAQRAFTSADQEAFAALSGDRNPMHMDEAVARQTQAGARAVHGIHTALWMLDRYTATGGNARPICRIKVNFARFIAVGQDVTVHLISATPSSTKTEARVIEARVDDQAVVVMTLGFDAGAGAGAPGAEVAGDLRPVPDRPLDLEFGAMGDVAGRLELSPGADPSGLFPALCGTIGAAAVGSLSLLSTVVGMIVPGLHSIFSGLSLTFRGEPVGPATVTFRPKHADDRFRLVTMHVSGAGFAGEISAFMRFPPVQPPTMERVATLVPPDQFKDRVALVVGGSRGLGAAVAKLVAAGGGEVVITYADNLAAAEAVAADINAHRKREVCRAVHYDARTPDLTGLGELGHFTHA
ncbi:MAG TPA: SDR family NAD(P)-dependent oxidoreductase [Urbifossiella sp.]|jgi:acyl dehydratase|nr:SDR family NAD(P)-dependent oxidoreductase [Urbifossiella sp.]